MSAFKEWLRTGQRDPFKVRVGQTKELGQPGTHEYEDGSRETIPMPTGSAVFAKRGDMKRSTQAYGVEHGKSGGYSHRPGSGPPPFVTEYEDGSQAIRTPLGQIPLRGESITRGAMLRLPANRAAPPPGHANVPRYYGHGPHPTGPHIDVHPDGTEEYLVPPTRRGRLGAALRQAAGG